MGQTITIDRSMLAQIEQQLELTTGSNVEFWDAILRITESKINGASYKLNGNRIIMDGMEADGLSVKVTIKSLTETTLVLHEVISATGLSITADMTYKKK